MKQVSQYKVINRFQEKNHEDHIYEQGDIYPAEGKKLVKTRADFLMKRHATYGVAFLEEVTPIPPPKKVPTKTATKKPDAVDPEQTSDEA